MRTLYFEGAGCEGTNVNDVENCRIRTAFKTDDGREFYLELLSGYENYPKGNIPEEIQKWSETITFPCRNNHNFISFGNMIIVDFCFEIHNGNGDCNNFRHPIERKRTMMPYTKANILRLVNENLNCSFDEVVILPWLSGYRVHSGNPKRKYNLMDDYIDVPARTAERNRIYHEEAKRYFEKIYRQHIKANPRAARFMSKYETWSLVKYTDKTITIRSHTYSELIDDNQRTHTFRVKY